MRLFQALSILIPLVSSVALAAPKSSFEGCEEALKRFRGERVFVTREMAPEMVGEDAHPIEDERGNWFHTRYLKSEAKRAKRRITVNGSGLLVTAKGRPFTTKGRKGHFGGRSLYVLSPTPSELYMSNEGVEGKFHHSSYLAGQPVAAPGTANINHGLVLELTANSGHYTPRRYHFLQFVQWLREQGANLDHAKIAGVFIDIGQGSWPEEVKAWFPLLDTLEELRWGTIENAVAHMNHTFEVLPIGPAYEVMRDELVFMLDSPRATTENFQRVAQLVSAAKSLKYGNFHLFSHLRKEFGTKKFVELSTSLLAANPDKDWLLSEWKDEIEYVAIIMERIGPRNDLYKELSKPEYAKFNSLIPWDKYKARWAGGKAYGAFEPEEGSNIILGGTD